MTDLVDVAIVGAGPYGLSLAAHLRAAGVPYRQFGLPMSLWRHRMPRGMYLKSQGFASNLSDPDGTHTLRNFCRETGREYADRGLPVSLETFVEYGEWFGERWAPDVERVLVERLREFSGRFLLTLSDGERLQARNVVIAVGVEHFARIPNELSELPRDRCTHSVEHDDLGSFAGQDVIVVGAGQSALESAALLHENGAHVDLVARTRNLVWNSPPLGEDRPLLQRMREPEAGLGSGLGTWFYSRHPRTFRRLPTSARVRRARHALGPAGAWWLRERVEGRIPIHTGHEIAGARTDGGRVQLTLRSDGATRGLAADHVIGATGYPPRLARLRFLDERLRSRVDTLDGAPRVGGDFQSSVPGLFVVGAAVTPTFGPVMRFVYGADFAARRVARRLAGTTAHRRVGVRGVAT